MRICVISLFPELIAGFLGVGIPRKAVAGGQLEVFAINPRDFATDSHRTVDDRPFGGGPGMVMKVEPLRAAIASAKDRLPGAHVIYLSPQGERFDQARARLMAGASDCILVAGRYEGIDERLLDTDIDSELSVGDFVLSGGEVAALAVIDAISRLLPGVLGHSQSAEQDSYGVDGLLDCPHYTRPEFLDGVGVPDVLLSGDHQRIAGWRRQQSLERTLKRRPDLIDRGKLSTEDIALLDALKKSNT